MPKEKNMQPELLVRPKIRKQHLRLSNRNYWKTPFLYRIKPVVTGEVSVDRESFGEEDVVLDAVSHNKELLKQFYFATTIGKANSLLAELISADPANEAEYRQTLVDAKKEWDALPSAVRIERYEVPAEDWIESLIRETPDANGNVREDYEYNERSEPSVADIANAIARTKIPSLENTIFLGTVNTIPPEGIDMAQANTSETEPTKNERGEIDPITFAKNLSSKIKSLDDKNEFKEFKDKIKYEPDRSKLGKELGLTKAELQDLENKNRPKTISFLKEKLDKVLKSNNLIQLQETGISTLDQIRNQMKTSFKLGKLEDNKASFKAIKDANPDIDLDKVKVGDILNVPTLEQYKKAYKEIYKEEYTTQTKAEAAREAVIKMNLPVNEGFQAQLYMDSKGNTTVGYGHTKLTLPKLFVSNTDVDDNKNLTNKEKVIVKQVLKEIEEAKSTEERQDIVSKLSKKLQKAIYTPIEKFPADIVPGSDPKVTYRALHPLGTGSLSERSALNIAGKDLKDRIHAMETNFKPGQTNQVTLDHLEKNFSKEQIEAVFDFIYWSGGYPFTGEDKPDNIKKKAGWTSNLYTALKESDSNQRFSLLTELFNSIEKEKYIGVSRINQWRGAFGIPEK